MIIKKLELKNFRSYREEVIEFPTNTILFEGDIGSGKSSILYAIEFALFGLGDMRGETLLSAGKNKCSARLTFDIQGKEYEIYRSLTKKNRGIVQDEGYILHDGKKEYLSPSDMRARILEILDFRENVRTRSSSVIFRYAIFTPQEEMKEILRLKPEDRLQTLRKAFGIEDYKIAKDNSKLVNDEIKTRIRVVNTELEGLDKLLSEKEDTEKSLDIYNKKLAALENKKNVLSGKLDSIRKDLKELESVKTEIEKLNSELPLLEKEYEEKKRQINELLEKNNGIKSQIEAKETEISKIHIERPTDKTKDELLKKMDSLNETKEKKIKEITKIEARIENFEKLLKEKVCPTCDRPVEPGEFNERLKRANSRLAGAEQEMENLKMQIKETKDVLEELEEYEKTREEKERMIEELEKLKKELEQNSLKLAELKNRINQLENEISLKKSKIEKNKDVFENIEKLEKEKREIDEKMEFLIRETGSLTGEIKTLENLRKKLHEEIENKKRKKEEKRELEQYSAWLSDHFMPSVASIEKHVLVSINNEFNSLFQKWFDMLMEGSDINVRIDENFTPLIEQNGYEMDINSLSGGEKTSVALSYRLALNLLVREVCTSMKSNLLILDEPTDGFSREQMSRVRDVLNELKCDQVIIVSHEKELESFVDHIFRVEKKAGVSSVAEI